MKYFTSTLGLFVVASVVALCQPQANDAHEFRWNWREAETADSTVAIVPGITAQERASLRNALAKQFEGDPQAEKQAGETRIKLVDLNGDGVSEVIAQAVGNVNCSPTGNCLFRAFQKTAFGYKAILEKGAVQSFTIQSTRTNGYLDLVLGMHGSATEQTLYLYQFRQGKYQRTACYEANWEYLDKNDEIHELKEPRITPCRR